MSSTICDHSCKQRCSKINELDHSLGRKKGLFGKFKTAMAISLRGCYNNLKEYQGGLQVRRTWELAWGLWYVLKACVNRELGTWLPEVVGCGADKGK